jgi:cysteine desulfurase/selenocysteine lyase
MKLENLIAEEFPQREGLIYLNHAGVAPWPRRTAEAIKRFAEENVTQGPVDYARWLGVERKLREQLQLLLNAPAADDIALLKNTSEGLSVIAYGLSWQRGDNIVISDQEFPSNRIVWESLQDLGVEVREASLDTETIPEHAIFKCVDDRTRLVAISSVQYATGLRMDLKILGDFCHDSHILFCIDAIQSLGAFSMDVQDIHADFVVADGHKWMLGPEGVAVFYCRPDLRNELKLRQYGWHMVEHHGDYDRKVWEIATSARRFECGSPNMAGIHAMQASLSLLLEIGIATISARIEHIVLRFIDGIAASDRLQLLSPQIPERRAGIIAFRDQQHEPAEILQLLLKRNVICAVRGGAIRFSPHFYLGDDQIDATIGLLR